LAQQALTMESPKEIYALFDAFSRECLKTTTV